MLPVFLLLGYSCDSRNLPFFLPLSLSIEINSSQEACQILEESGKRMSGDGSRLGAVGCGERNRGRKHFPEQEPGPQNLMQDTRELGCLGGKERICDVRLHRMDMVSPSHRGGSTLCIFIHAAPLLLLLVGPHSSIKAD